MDAKPRYIEWDPPHVERDGLAVASTWLLVLALFLWPLALASLITGAALLHRRPGRGAVVMAVSVVLLYFGAALTWTASAHAWRERRAVEVGNAIWKTPCGSVPVAVAWQPPPPGLERASGWAYEGRCVVYLNDELRHRARNWRRMCHIIVHEMGHIAGWRDPLTGHVHAEDPWSIMSIGAGFHMDRRCRDRGRAVLGLAPGGYGWR